MNQLPLIILAFLTFLAISFAIGLFLAFITTLFTDHCPKCGSTNIVMGYSTKHDLCLSCGAEWKHK